MDEGKRRIEVNEYIETTLTHGKWYDQFSQWLESRNESLIASPKYEVKVLVSSSAKLSNEKRKKKITIVDFRTEDQKRATLMARLASVMFPR